MAASAEISGSAVCACPVGSGGAAGSALEMVQNSLRYSWSRREVDEKLRGIMSSIYDASAAAAEEYGLGYDLIAGNDIAAFKKISDAMIAQGLSRQDAETQLREAEQWRSKEE